ncbi:MAG: N-acetyl-gamma-glutamyl-phosphate reductase [Dictyoglomaceae bacterium]|nr:N-acetyl-gamma-glutamyl-phosphate reductase [Dictyoglomaceae bacterium]
MKLKVSVLGATGYTGVELVRILRFHPKVEFVSLTSQSYIGKSFSEVYPHFHSFLDYLCEEENIEEIVEKSDCIFTALPHGHAMNIAKEVFKKGKVLIDLGADFRIKNPKIYEEWYKIEHTAKDLLPFTVYGLCEIYRNEIKNSKIIANPGCYPTSIILALAPLLKENLIDEESIIIDSKSGVSGAGRSLSLNTHFCEVNENIKAYSIPNHRHIPEIEQELSLIAKKELRISFTPHLIPVNRGILSTIYGKLQGKIIYEEILELYKNFYEKEKFIRILPREILPITKNVLGTNFCDIGFVVDERTKRIIIISVIDNLIKGASGQAVQNMNIIFGFEEDEGLKNISFYP